MDTTNPDAQAKMFCPGQTGLVNETCIAYMQIIVNGGGKVNNIMDKNGRKQKNIFHQRWQEYAIFKDLSSWSSFCVLSVDTG